MSLIKPRVDFPLYSFPHISSISSGTTQESCCFSFFSSECQFLQSYSFQGITGNYSLLAEVLSFSREHPPTAVPVRTGSANIAVVTFMKVSLQWHVSSLRFFMMISP